MATHPTSAVDEITVSQEKIPSLRRRFFFARVNDSFHSADVQRFAIKGRLQTPAGMRHEAVDNTNWMTVRMMRLPDEGSPLLLHQPMFDALQRILPTVRHLHVAPVIALDRDDFGYFAAYVAMEGETLVDWLRFHGVMTLDDAASLAENCLLGLQALQEHQVIHGDVCPARITVKRDALMALNAILIEPGFAFLLHSVEPETPGTPVEGHDVSFTAPELFLRQTPDIRSDLYALGATLYYCLTGQLPFTGSSPQSIVNAHLQHSPAALEEFRADLPPAFCAWIMKLLSRDPNLRPTSAPHAIQLLKEALGKVPVAAAPQPSRAPAPRLATPALAAPKVATAIAPKTFTPQRKKSSSPVPWIIGAVVALCALVLIIVMSNSSSPKPTAPAPIVKDEAPANYPIGRYVRVENRNGKVMNFAECLVICDGKNSALTGVASSSSVDYGGPAKNGNDGNTTQQISGNSLVHTKGGEEVAWWEVDLLAEKPIESIIVWNRKEPKYHESSTRMDGFQVVILDSKRKEIYRSDPTKAPDASVTFDLKNFQNRGK